MTTHDRDKVIAAARKAAMGEPLMGMTPPELISFVERLYVIAFEAGRQAEREERRSVFDFSQSASISGNDTK